jgi:cytochrome c oxidase subunit II
VRSHCAAVLVLGAPALSGCAGEQSAFSPSGAEADRTLQLAWVMFAGGAAILVLVCVLTVLAIAGPQTWRAMLRDKHMVVGLGLVFPVVVLSALLLSGFVLMRAGPAVAGSGETPVRIAVSGEQWWWRVTYEGEDGKRFESANELVVPTGRLVEIELTSADVIHSFWVPAYAGKVDMIPGRTNRITLLVDTPGVRRGQCAEYCGGAHALMSFHVVALPPAKFEARLAHEAGDAVAIGQRDGEQAFLRTGCGACHSIRGTPAVGVAGPNLTHVASRQTLGAGILPTDADGFAKWIEIHREIKPQNEMPPFDFLKPEEVRLIAEYLAALE